MLTDRAALYLDLSHTESERERERDRERDFPLMLRISTIYTKSTQNQNWLYLRYTMKNIATFPRGRFIKLCECCVSRGPQPTNLFCGSGYIPFNGPQTKIR